jgi:hypothetical protein
VSVHSAATHTPRQDSDPPAALGCAADLTEAYVDFNKGDITDQFTLGG